MSKERIMVEIDTLERVEGYFRNLPVEVSITLLRNDIERSKDSLEKEKKRESNSKYRNLHI